MRDETISDGVNPVPGKLRGVRGALIIVWVMPGIILGSGKTGTVQLNARRTLVLRTTAKFLREFRAAPQSEGGLHKVSGPRFNAKTDALSVTCHRFVVLT
jgi:hypothetical protein